VAAAIVVILAVATWVLFFHPDSTDRHFAWTIRPQMTTRLMGVGYGSALYFSLAWVGATITGVAALSVWMESKAIAAQVRR
jgi:Mn2+/Fe2+ NRAMP family transporter